MIVKKPKDAASGRESSARISNIEMRPVSSLSPFKGNARIHPRKQISQITKSIDHFGWTNPILVDEKGVVLSGHGRLEAAQKLGIKEVPVIKFDHLSSAEKRAYVIADNKIAENARWDTDLLSIEFDSILEIDDSFDLELTGYDTGEIDIIQDEPSDQDCAVAEPKRDGPATNRKGDLWRIGRHQLYCGDSLRALSWKRLMGEDLADIVVTDPPYNVRIAGNVSGLGANKHREFKMASGEMQSDEFIGFLRTAFQQLAKYSTNGAIHYVCMDWRHMGEVIAASNGVYDELKNLCVWAKTNAGMGSFYRSQHELVFVFKSGTAPHINNFGLGEKGRHRTNLWTYPGANAFHPDRANDLASHPTVKPIAMVRDAILDCSKRNGIVLDAFAGAGTTLVAAARSSRRGYGIEIDPHYADLILHRLQEETGEPAIHAETLETFESMRKLRSEERVDD